MNSNLFRLSPFFFRQANSDGGEGNDNGGDGGNDKQGDPEAQVTFKTFDDWYKSLSEDQKKIVDPGKAHFDRVYSTLSTVRTERDNIDKQWKDAIKALKDGPDKERFEQLAKENDELKTKTQFLEDAPAYKCLNAKAAYAIMKSQGLYDRKGDPDWTAIAKEAPELFGEMKRKQATRKTAGEGNQAPSGNASMNDWIRNQAGKGVITQDQ